MILKDLLVGLDCTVKGAKNADVTGISIDSRSVAAGDIFVAMPGEHVDGYAFIKDAANSGAACVMAEKETGGLGIPEVIVPDVRYALSRLSDTFYASPSKDLVMVGITGTNGKTTTSYLIESIIKASGHNPGVIGTINCRYNGKTIPAIHTTPQAPDLHRTLRQMADAGVTHCVMEVSSHALSQKRVAHCAFDAAVFTNLTHDHLDYHQTMDRYYASKAALFTLLKKGGGVSITNMDDEWGARLKAGFPASLTYSLKPGADVYPVSSRLADGMTEAEIQTPGGSVRVSSHLAGEYNLQNMLAAIAVSYAIGMECDFVAKGIGGLERVPGRLEKIDSGDFRAYVDYAHTPDALARALGALKAISSGRIITVFGCGGNRDRTKRPEMGAVSARLSDLSIVTSDNPRDEDPAGIIAEIESGMSGARRHEPGDAVEGRGYMVVPDRAEAIKAAVKLARGGDTVLVAGKGHEDYQIVKGRRTRFSDMDELAAAIRLSTAGKKAS